MAGGPWDPNDPYREPVGSGDEQGFGRSGGGWNNTPAIPGGMPQPGPGPFNPFGYGGAGGGGRARVQAGYGGFNRRRRPQMDWMNASRPSFDGLPGYQSPQTPQTQSQPDYWDAIMSRFSGDGTGYTNAAGTDAEALLDMIIGGKGRGAFGPGGDPNVMSAYDADATRRGLDMENAAVLGAGLDGGDPWNTSLARTMARANAGRARNDFFNQNRLNSANRYNDLMQFALQHKVGEYDTGKQREWGLQDQSSQRQHESKMFPWELGGQLAGAAIGSWGGGKGKKGT